MASAFECSSHCVAGVACGLIRFHFLASDIRSHLGDDDFSVTHNRMGKGVLGSTSSLLPVSFNIASFLLL